MLLKEGPTPVRGETCKVSGKVGGMTTRGSRNTQTKEGQWEVESRVYCGAISPERPVR